MSSRDWPTSGSMRNGRCSRRPAAEPRTSAGAGSALLPTSTASEYGSGGSGCPGDGRAEYAHKGSPSLATMARQNRWPTPTASDAQRGACQKRKEHRKNGTTLVDAVRWPTPTAGDAKSSGSRNLEGSKANAGVSLTDAVLHGNSTTPRDGAPGGQLNPEFVEWLMGWPIGWTDFERPATESYRKWLRAHGACSLGGSGRRDQ